jgi:hypothetical protein
VPRVYQRPDGKIEYGRRLIQDSSGQVTGQVDGFGASLNHSPRFSGLSRVDDCRCHKMHALPATGRTISSSS